MYKIKEDMTVALTDSVNESVEELKMSTEFKLFSYVMGILIVIAIFFIISLSSYKEDIITQEPVAYVIGNVYKIETNQYINIVSEDGTTTAYFLGDCTAKPNLIGKEIMVQKLSYVYSSIIQDGTGIKLSGVKEQVCKS